MNCWVGRELSSWVEERKVTIVGVMRGILDGSVLMVSVPMEVWTLLRGDPPYMFVAVV